MGEGHYDAVVIGSGPNGLSAAITLAEAGRSVLVCEAQDHLGGAMATEELTLPGYDHDVFSAVYPASAASPVFARWPLADHGLEWVEPELQMVHVLEDGQAAVLARDVEVTRASLNALAPGDGDRWAAFAAPWLEHFEAVRSTMLAGFPPVVGPARLALGLGLDGILEFARLLLEPSTGLASELFSSPGAAAWLHSAALHGDTPPDGSGSAIAGVYLNVLGHAVGWPSPRGGAGRLADALVGHLHGLGGETRTGAPVTKVLAGRGRVRGVVAGGEVVRARMVISTSSAPALLAMAQDVLDPGYVRKLMRFRPGPQTVKVDWALDGPIPWTSPEARRSGTVHVGGDDAELLHAVGEGRQGRLPERPFMLLGQQTVTDPTRAPAGKHTAWAYAHAAFGMDAPGAPERWADAMDAHVEHFAPGFRDLVLARSVLGPDEMQARDDNLIKGDVGAGSYILDQLVFRPVPGLSPYRTPLRGLWLGSASTFPGGAVHGVPGDAAARQALLADRLSPARLAGRA
jgi:phytoene dehydrogenase-like protein